MKSDWKSQGRQTVMTGSPGPNHAQSLVSLLTDAVKALQAGDPQAARRLAKRSLSLAPDNADCHVVMATACHNLDRLVDAERHYTQCLRLKPDHVRARINLGMIQLNAERGDEAVVTLQKAVSDDPSALEARHYLARAYGLCDRIFEAVEQFKVVERAQPENPEVLAGYAKVLTKAGHTSEAIEILRRAMKVHSKDHRILRELGTNHAALGEFDSAEEAMREAIKLAPDSTGVYFQLASIKRLTSDDIDFLEQRLKHASDLSDENRAGCYYAMGAVLEDKQDYAQAFAAFSQANEIMDASVEYDRADKSARFERLTLASDGASSESWPKGNVSEKPIFIVGMPRSGTTLVEQILAGHPEIYPGGEQRTISLDVLHLLETDQRYDMAVENFGVEQLNQLGAFYLDRLPVAAAASLRVTDKMPGNIEYLPLIARMFPNARFILCRRHPMDVVWSIYKQSFGRALRYATNLGNIAHILKLTSSFSDHWMSEMPRRSLEVCYEDLTGNFETNARRIVEFAGVKWNDACLDTHKVIRSVRTASVWQVRQPVYKSSVGLWRNYDTQLADAKNDLADQIAAYELMAGKLAAGD